LLFAVVAQSGVEMPQSHNVPGSELAGYTKSGDWVDRFAGQFFQTRSSFDWFVKQNRRELIETGALIPRGGRSGSLVSIEKMPKAVIAILRRKASAGEKA
jgi:hypothetical protein